jgi:hypothetical protein
LSWFSHSLAMRNAVGLLDFGIVKCFPPGVRSGRESRRI